MCVFIYTLPQLCRHPQFQNVCECATVRGAPETETKSLTLAEPKFLFDTEKGGLETPAYYEAQFPCKKRKAVRPVPTLWCAKCMEGQAAGSEAGTVMGQVQDLPVVGGSSGNSSGSNVGLVPASGSGSSDLTSASGKFVYLRRVWSVCE